MGINFSSSLVEMAGTAPASRKVPTLHLLFVFYFGLRFCGKKTDKKAEKHLFIYSPPYEIMRTSESGLIYTFLPYKFQVKAFVAGHSALRLKSQATLLSD